MLKIDEYISPSSISQALDLLQEKSSMVIGGGLEFVLLKPYITKVIDLTSLNLSYIKQTDKWIKIGATTNYTNLVNSEILQKKYNGIISKAAQATGSLQIRNQATIGGNIGARKVYSDLIPALIAVKANVKLNGEDRIIPVTEYFDIASKEKHIIEEILIPADDENFTGAYIRMGRTEFDFAIVNIAMAIKLKDNYCEDISIGMGGVAHAPFRAIKTENVLKSKIITQDLMKEAQAELLEEIKPMTDLMGSSDYKKELATVFLKRAVIECLANKGVTV